LDVLKKIESPCKMCWKSGSIWAKMMMFVSITRFLMSCLTFSHGFGMVFVETTSFFLLFHNCAIFGGVSSPHPPD
jgi:hypothetical protein